MNDVPNTVPLRVAIAAALVLLLVTPAAVSAATAREMFRQGVEAAQEDEYEQAVEHFEAARQAGLDTGALHFNLGVALYRVGRLDEAEAAFLRAVESGSMVAPAHYQLGRIARERGETARARDAFRRAARTAKTASLRKRARAALAALDTAPSSPDYIYLGLGGGHDSNIALTPSDASGTSEQSDQFLDAVLVGRWPLEDRFYLRGSAYLQEFFDEDQFSLLALRGGVGRVGRLRGAWEWNAWVDGRHQRLGGDAFDNALLAGGRLQRPLNAGWRLRLDYELELARGASGFGFLDGVEHRFDVSFDERGRSGWTLAAGVATSDRDDLATADDFFSFSYDEVSLEADHTFRLDADHHLTLSGDWRHRDYDGPEVRAGTPEGTREEDRYGLAVALDRRLDRDWSVRADLRVERRDSTVTDFDYDREMVRVRVERVF
ncbi:MAG: tetratricopeptide repeat protein [Halofilum sp. (in: g-proteobacteria)]|nr:tetratricopeptide repeat protein [Halofilum sp. (in: g-proteobacteria)]